MGINHFGTACRWSWPKILFQFGDDEDDDDNYHFGFPLNVIAIIQGGPKKTIPNFGGHFLLDDKIF